MVSDAGDEGGGFYDFLAKCLEFNIVEINRIYDCYETHQLRQLLLCRA